MTDPIEMLKITSLPQYEVYVRAVDQNMKYLAIAAELSIPVGTVRSRLNRARRKMRKYRETVAHQ